MRKLSAIIILSLLSFGVRGQEKFARVTFDGYSHGFGTIEEADGPVSRTFTFTNTGDVPFIITSVSVSCGCTTPEFSKAPVKPGATGKFKVTFDPENRPGMFEKQVHLVCNTEEKAVTLTLRGNVNPRPRTMTEDYPHALSDGLRIAAIDKDMGTIPRGKVSRGNVGVGNSGKEAVRIGVKGDNLPEFVRIVPRKATLEPGERSEIEITVDGAKTDKWGEVTFAFFPVINSRVQQTPITVSAIFVEDFSNLIPSQIENAPRIDFSSYFYHFSQQKKGTVLTRTFDFRNGGKSNLAIRYLDTTSSAIIAASSKTELEPGEEAVVTIKINTAEVPAGRLSESVRVITNDPAKPVREIRVMATMVE